MQRESGPPNDKLGNHSALGQQASYSKISGGDHFDIDKDLEDDSIDNIYQDGWVSRTPIRLDDYCSRFEPKAIDNQYQSVTYRPDAVLDGWANEYCVIRAASLRGMSHRYYGKPRQDDISIRSRNDLPAVIVTVADGVSSVSHAHIASTAAARYTTQWLMQEKSINYSAIDWERLMSHASEALVKQAESIEADIGRQLSDVLRVVATTVVCAVLFPSPDSDLLQVEIASVGDSGAWIIEQGEITLICGGKKDDNSDIYDGSTRCLPDVSPCLEKKSLQISRNDVLLIGTDGFGDPLGDGTSQVGKLFSSVLSKRIPSIIEFGHMLDFTLKTYCDDRSLVAIWPKALDA